ncbi:MAG: NAD kinase [Cyclobacteriaceae bacterium]
MRIAIHGRKINKESYPFVQAIFEELAKRNVDIIVSKAFVAQSNSSGLNFGDFPIYEDAGHIKNVDYFFSLGGDGTLLETVTHVGAFEIPILGINLGRLGFLATISKTNIQDALGLFFEKKFTFDERILIHLESENGVFENNNFALNEVAVLKRDTSSMIAVNCHINGEYVNTYWADGLMVSTPTGSTGYSLSCGGPLVLPQSDNFIITPISPHNLNVRPLIVSGSSVITLEIDGDGRKFLTSLDSRSYTLNNKVKLTLRRESFKARLIKLEGYHFFDTLRTKLNWGLDIRN